eukprot:scaffold4078_cov68-Phaeocystis_antarctica.AAC.27
MRTELRRAHSRGTRSGVESPRSAVLTAATSIGARACAGAERRGARASRTQCSPLQRSRLQQHAVYQPVCVTRASTLDHAETYSAVAARCMVSNATSDLNSLNSTGDQTLKDGAFGGRARGVFRSTALGLRTAGCEGQQRGQKENRCIVRCQEDAPI